MPHQHDLRSAWEAALAHGLPAHSITLELWLDWLWVGVGSAMNGELAMGMCAEVDPGGRRLQGGEFSGVGVCAAAESSIIGLQLPTKTTAVQTQVDEATVEARVGDEHAIVLVRHAKPFTMKTAVLNLECSGSAPSRQEVLLPGTNIRFAPGATR